MVSSTSKMVITFLWYLCSILLYSSMAHWNFSVRCNIKDREILEIFKGSIEDRWELLTSWSSEEDCCHWLGVHCDNHTGRVTKIDLHCPLNSKYPKCLGGQINLSVLNLEFLSYLDLHDNDFHALIHIPSIHGYASNETTHHMSMMRTPHHGTNLSNLIFLDLSYNSFLRIDNLVWVISHLTSLQNLDLSYVDLSKETLWLQWVTMLPSRLELRLSHCFLDNIQPSLRFVNISSLEVLDFSYNNFNTEVPKWLFNLSGSISHLDLSFNSLRGQVPEGMSNFQLLKSLLLHSNNFTGSIPEWVGQYKQLEHLFLRCNSFSGPIPETLGNLSSLAHLAIGQNELNGSLPKSLGQLLKLRFFGAAYNWLSGPISPFFCQTVTGNKKLMALHMAHNLLSGELPDCWIQWKKHLKVVVLRSNNFNGSIPPQICPVSNLQVLDLADNKLSGSIPKCLSSMTTMATITPRVLFFKNYYYNGKKIDRDTLRTYLLHLPFFYRGPGHEYWANVLKFMILIDLSMNDFSGSIPQELFSLVAMISLNLSHNHLMGSIPDNIGHMRSLESLDLSGNQLAGEIPQSLGDLSYLSFLNLSYNNFSGRIPLGPRLQSFDASSYMGNSELYGTPLTMNYSQGEIPNERKQMIEGGDDEFSKWFYFGTAIGFAYGFWGVCFALFFFKDWRHTCFRFLNDMNDRIYVFIALKTKWFR